MPAYRPTTKLDVVTLCCAYYVDGKRNALVSTLNGLASVRASVRLCHLISNHAAHILNMTHQGAARDAASVRFIPSITSADILVKCQNGL